MKKIFVYIMLIALVNGMNFGITGKNISFDVPLVAGNPSCNPIPHGSIQIASDSDFKQANSGVTAGTGITTDPYIIGNWQIKDLSNGYGIKVDNSGGKITKSFKIQCIQSNFDQIQPSGTKFINIINIHSPTTISDIQGNSLDAHEVIGV